MCLCRRELLSAFYVIKEISSGGVFVEGEAFGLFTDFARTSKKARHMSTGRKTRCSLQFNNDANMLANHMELWIICKFDFLATDYKDQAG